MTSSNLSKYVTASSTLKKMAAHSSASTNSSILRAKIHEMAVVAEKPVTAPAVSSLKSAPFCANSNNTKSSVSNIQHPMIVPTSQLKTTTALKSIFDPANKATQSSSLAVAAAAKPKVEEKPLSPMQTYDMSDRDEESDESDSDDEYETQKPKKKIPEWAQRHNLHRALERQFADGPNRLDPDRIFGEVLTCNLEDIFDKKKSRYQRRTSSGNWAKDHVTIAEKLTYKRTMGYQK